MSLSSCPTDVREQGIGKAALARRLHCHLQEIDRLLDLQARRG